MRKLAIKLQDIERENFDGLSTTDQIPTICIAKVANLVTTLIVVSTILRYTFHIS